jgi:hypothetical protein
MRFRVGLVLCLFAAYVTAGCRTALTPNIDRNAAPETWITAAPFDTLTYYDDEHKPRQPDPETIPVRFHVYWAGSDLDGQVAGFYWAVTETLPRPEEGFLAPPPLPGPKPSSYHYTTRTDSVFVFSVAEGVADRRHAFFIYAVDNLGKVDPTPARFIFNAADTYKPIPIFTVSKGIGVVWERDGGGNLIPVEREYPITDIAGKGRVPRDTVPANATLVFGWSSKSSAAGTAVTGFKYKLEEPTFVTAAPGQNEVRYHTGVGADTIPVSSGAKIFTVRVIDQAGGSNDSTRSFIVNFSPDTWWSGPDPSSPAWNVKPNGEKWIHFSAVRPGGALYESGITGSLFGPDSVKTMPANRPERRTFIELWRDTLYLRAEFDTIHMNAYTIMHNGGFDNDSPYRVVVTDLARSTPGYLPEGDINEVPVVWPQGVTGSPIGFRMRASYSTTPDEADMFFGQSGLYPLFDPNDVNGLPKIANYFPHYITGKAYMLPIAEDGDGARDGRIQSPRQLTSVVDSGGGTPQEIALRPKVMVIYVNKAPYFVENPTFTPLPGHIFTDANWNFRLPAADSDPYDGSDRHGGPVGASILRRTIYLKGKNAAGEDITLQFGPYFQEQFSFVVPPELAPGPVDVEMELCDCATCEVTRGQGRCIRQVIPVVYAPASPTSLTGNR